MDWLHLLSGPAIFVVFAAAIFYVPRLILTALRYKKQAAGLFEKFACLLAENDGGHQLRGDYIKGLMEQIVLLDSQSGFEEFSEVKLSKQVYEDLMRMALGYHIAVQQNRISLLMVFTVLVVTGLATLLLIRLSV